MKPLDAAPLALVADDDPDVLDLLGEMLGELGLRTLTTADADAVLELAAAHRPAVILLDIMMPDVDGYTLATRLHGDARTAAIPIIFITGQGAPIYRTLSYGVGAVAYVQKPFTTTTLRTALGRALST